MKLHYYVNPQVHRPHSSVDLRQPMATRLNWIQRLWRKCFARTRRFS